MEDTINDSPQIKENKRFPGIIKSWSAAPGLLRLCLKLWEKMKNRSCIIMGSLYESAQVHLTQTPVWNAFWVTCCLALMSIILKSGRDRTLVELSGRFMGCYRRPPPPPLTCRFSPAFCFDSLGRLLWFWRLSSDKRFHSLPGFGFLDGPESRLRGQLTPQAARVKFRGTFKHMVFGVQSVTQEEPRKRRKVTLKH